MNALLSFIGVSSRQILDDETTARFDTTATVPCEDQDPQDQHNFFQDDQEYFNSDKYREEMYEEIMQDRKYEMVFHNTLRRIVVQLNAETTGYLPRLMKIHEFLRFLLSNTDYWGTSSYELFRMVLYKQLKNFTEELEKLPSNYLPTPEITHYKFAILALIQEIYDIPTTPAITESI
jgi:hypothetical protein